MTAIPVIPYGISAEASVQIGFGTSVSESEGGYSSRLELKPLLRSYTVTIGPDDAVEISNIAIASRGAKWVVALRDWANNYALDKERQTFNVVNDYAECYLTRKFQPKTGSRFYVQRILLIDEAETPFNVYVNDVLLDPAAWSIEDPGVLYVDQALAPSANLSVSGHYLTPVVFIDDGVTLTLHNRNVFSVQNIHLREILDKELMDLIAQEADQ